MGNKPTKVPLWNTGGANNVEPSAGNKVDGWLVNADPPSSTFNWLQKLYGDWITWLDDRVTNTGGTAPRMGFRGLASTGEAGGTGGTFTGDTTGDGVDAQGGATNAHGIKGTAGGNGDGVRGLASGTGAGVKADASGGTGPALNLAPNATKAAIHSGSTAAPAGAQGDMYVDATTQLWHAWDSRRSLWQSLAVPFVTVGDGVNSWGDFNGSDETPINAAIAALPNGGVVFLKRGTWTCTAGGADRINISTANIMLIGEGQNLSIIKGSTTANGLIKVNAAGVRFENIQVEQTGGAGSVVRVLDAGTDFEMYGCYLKHSEGDTATSAVYCLNYYGVPTRSRVQRCRFYFKASATASMLRAAIHMEIFSGAAAADVGEFWFIDNRIVFDRGAVVVAGSSIEAAFSTNINSGGAGNLLVHDVHFRGNIFELVSATANGEQGFNIQGQKGSTGTCTLDNWTIAQNHLRPAASIANVFNPVVGGATFTNCQFYGNRLASVTYTTVTDPVNTWGLAGKFVATSSGGSPTSKIVDASYNIIG